MTKWTDEFIAQFHEVGTVKKLTQEIKDASDKKRVQDQADRDISRVCRGEVKRLIQRKKR